jgi:hypothetical protein
MPQNMTLITKVACGRVPKDAVAFQFRVIDFAIESEPGIDGRFHDA